MHLACTRAGLVFRGLFALYFITVYGPADLPSWFTVTIAVPSLICISFICTVNYVAVATQFINFLETVGLYAKMTSKLLVFLHSGGRIFTSRL